MFVKIIKVFARKTIYTDMGSSEEISDIVGLNDWEEIDDEQYESLVYYINKCGKKDYDGKIIRPFYLLLIKPEPNVQTVQQFLEYAKEKEKLEVEMAKKKKEKARKAAITKKKNKEEKEKKTLEELKKKYEKIS